MSSLDSSLNSPPPDATSATGERSTSPADAWEGKSLWAWVGLLLLAIVAAYANSLSAPLVLDDSLAISANPSIRDLTAFRAVLWPPAESPTGGRPLLNLTFALNYAWGGTAVQSYHAINLLIHLAATLVVFLLVRQTLLSPGLRARFARESGKLALASAALWALHPMQTVSVTYLSQRAESLMGLCYLLTLYFFARGAATPNSRPWHLLSLGACLCGMATKEVMITAPVIVWLYDATFFSGTFAAAWRRHRRFYWGLAATWAALAGLMLGSQLRSRGIADGGNFTWWSYALTECRVVPQYLKLAVWPHPLIFDYDVDRTPLALGDLMRGAGSIALLLAATIAACRRRPALGFLGAWFFVILAPTSSVVPVVMQPMAESRMYLPLLAVVVFIVIAARQLAAPRSWALLAIVALGLATSTRARNAVYASELALWGDTVAKRPQNARAQNSYAVALAHDPTRLADQLLHLDAALRLKPDYVEAHNNLGNALLRIPSRWPEAIAHYETALRYNPQFVQAHLNLGNVCLAMTDRWDEAVAHLRAAVQLAPNYDVAHYYLAKAFAQKPELLPAAIGHYRTALALNPSFADAHNGLGVALATTPSTLDEAILHYREALKLRPADDQAHNNLAVALATSPSRLPEAVAHYEHALRINPGNVDARVNLAAALANLPGRAGDAAAQLEEALRARPGDARAHFLLGRLLLDGGQGAEGLRHLKTASQLAPEWSEVRTLLNRVSPPP